MIGLRVVSARPLPKRRQFDLNDEQVFRLSEASRRNAHPVIVQARANAVWGDIARSMHFDQYSIEPVGPRQFTAVPLPMDERDGGVIVLPTFD